MKLKKPEVSSSFDRLHALISENVNELPLPPPADHPDFANWGGGDVYAASPPALRIHKEHYERWLQERRRIDSSVSAVFGRRVLLALLDALAEKVQRHFEKVAHSRQLHSASACFKTRVTTQLTSWCQVARTEAGLPPEASTVVDRKHRDLYFKELRLALSTSTPCLAAV
ncbi:MAG: hypothetical protein MHM6MM_008349, partial [Cercozoa sp. M6MM]